jgi:hypothetical protein
MLYPTFDLFGTYDYTTSPAGMLPIAPNELLLMVKDPTVAQPFSQNILRGGASISMPIFVKSIYTMAAKAKTMYKSAEQKKYIDLLKNEAMLVSLNANLKYLNQMIVALDKKKQSIEKTKEIVTIKVNNQRAPKSVLLKINDALNQIALAKSGIELKKSEILSMIQTLTGIYLNKEMEMTLYLKNKSILKYSVEWHNNCGVILYSKDYGRGIFLSLTVNKKNVPCACQGRLRYPVTFAV